MSCLWLRWQLCSRGQWIHVQTFTSFALNPTWMKPAHSINSAYHVCLELWMRFMPRKLQAIKNTFYAKFKTASLMILLHSHNCIDSYKASPHLVHQKQQKDQAFAFNLHYRVVQRCVQTWLWKKPVQRKGCCPISPMTPFPERVSTSTAGSQHASPLSHKLQDIIGRKAIGLLILK